MRKTIALTAAAGALLFGGAGAATADTVEVSSPHTTTLAADDYDNGSDNTGLWGLAGLLGLLGLLGMRNRHNGTDRRVTAGTSMKTSGSTSNPTVPHNNPGPPPPTV